MTEGCPKKTFLDSDVLKPVFLIIVEHEKRIFNGIYWEHFGIIYVYIYILAYFICCHCYYYLFAARVSPPPKKDHFKLPNPVWGAQF